jgi:uncharacterized membrane protein
MTTKRPKLKIKKSPLDMLIIGMGWIGALGLILVPALYFAELPDSIPRHFDAKGYPDAYGSKWNLWVLSAIGIAIFAGIKFLANKPEILNYPVKIDESNAKRQYTMAQRMLRTLNVVIAYVFLYLIYSTVKIALNRAETTGKYALPVILGAMTVILMGYLFASTNKRRKKKKIA